MELYKDILNAPHTLIAGTTGSGKSVLLNGIIRELMETYIPEQKKLILIDPKRVELSQYKNTEFCTAYTSDYQTAITYLDNSIALIEDRYKAMERAGTKQTTQYHLYIIIDELADLMISPAAREIKLKMQKILQIGRAAGVHIIAATQAPNRKIIPAELVLNFTNRIALRCLSSIESRQIINISGAETLPKHGKGLYLSPDGVKRVTIPLTPDNADLIQKWERTAPTYTPPAPSTYKYTYRTYERPTYKKDKTSIIDTIKIACVILGILFLWSIM